MSKPKASEAPSLRNNFFHGQKRRITIQSWSPKHNGESEKRALIELQMPLTGEQQIGIPQFAIEEFKDLEREDSQAKSIELRTEIENMSAELFDTPESLEGCHEFHGATLRGFSMERVPKGDSHITVLNFNLTVIRTIPLLVWLHKYERKDVWALFEPTQGEIKAKNDGQMKLGEDRQPKPGPELAATA
jgi:hypothetical protein